MPRSGLVLPRQQRRCGARVSRLRVPRTAAAARRWMAARAPWSDKLFRLHTQVLSSAHAGSRHV